MIAVFKYLDSQYIEKESCLVYMFPRGKSRASRWKVTGWQAFVHVKKELFNCLSYTEIEWIGNWLPALG